MSPKYGSLGCSKVWVILSLAHQCNFLLVATINFVTSLGKLRSELAEMVRQGEEGCHPNMALLAVVKSGSY